MKPTDIDMIGYLPEERGLYKKMKVGEQALYLARLKGLSKHDAQVRLKYWFDKFEIGSWYNRKLEELSKGMAQKIQFIITVLHEPKLLIFDEPFSGFDPVNVQLLKDEIMYLKQQGATVIFSTHNMSSVEEICDEISLINKSQVVLQGKVNDIRRRFNKGVYVLKADLPAGGMPQGTLYETLSSEEKNGKLTLQLQKKSETSTRELLGELSSQYEIHGFEEQISSMNDIFIQTVQQ
jgi:ABC-2 type transport system ATP-binding protein